MSVCVVLMSLWLGSRRSATNSLRVGKAGATQPLCTAWSHTVSHTNLHNLLRFNLKLPSMRASLCRTRRQTGKNSSSVSWVWCRLFIRCVRSKRTNAIAHTGSCTTPQRRGRGLELVTCIFMLRCPGEDAHVAMLVVLLCSAASAQSSPS